MELDIRPATPDDAAVLHEIVQSAFAEYDGVLVVRPRALGDTPEEAKRAIAEGGVLLAWDSDQAVGSVRYEIQPDCLYVGRLAVLPSHRRRGVGIALMKYVENLAPKMGRSRVALWTRQSMPSNLAFYSRLGYRVEKTEPNSRGPDTNVWFVKDILSSFADKLIWQRIGQDLAPLVGKRLLKVIYWCLSYEMTPEELDQPFQSLGGEVEIEVEGRSKVYIRWGNNPPEWKQKGIHYSVEALSESAFIRDDNEVTLDLFDASQTHVWKSVMGTVLRGIDVLGDEGVPYILRFRFDDGLAYVGVGSGPRRNDPMYERDLLVGGFGDNDDLLVWAEDEFNQYERKWSSSGWSFQHMQTIDGGSGS